MFHIVNENAWSLMKCFTWKLLCTNTMRTLACCRFSFQCRRSEVGKPFSTLPRTTPLRLIASSFFVELLIFCKDEFFPDFRSVINLSDEQHYICCLRQRSPDLSHSILLDAQRNKSTKTWLKLKFFFNNRFVLIYKR